jgi:hypothetical protein
MDNTVEFRSCGRFSGAEIRALLGPKAVDMRTFGAPESIMLSILEKRALRAAGMTDEQRRARLASVTEQIRASEARLNERPAIASLTPQPVVATETHKHRRNRKQW